MIGKFAEIDRMSRYCPVKPTEKHLRASLKLHSIILMKNSEKHPKYIDFIADAFCLEIL